MKTLVINFKTYEEATGRNAETLAKICRDVLRENDAEIIVCPQYADLKMVSNFGVKVFSQHIDPVLPEKNTGAITALSVKSSGAFGTLLNHSEKKLTPAQLKQCVSIAKDYGLTVLCFTKDLKETREVLKLEPDMIAYEPAELVGSGKSVSKNKPKTLASFVRLVRKTNPNVKVLCGAGISNGDDVKKAIEFGVDGVALSSAFVKAANPEYLLKEIVSSLK